MGLVVPRGPDAVGPTTSGASQGEWARQASAERPNDGGPRAFSEAVEAVWRREPLDVTMAVPDLSCSR